MYEGDGGHVLINPAPRHRFQEQIIWVLNFVPQPVAAHPRRPRREQTIEDLIWSGAFECAAESRPFSFKSLDKGQQQIGFLELLLNRSELWLSASLPAQALSH